MFEGKLGYSFFMRWKNGLLLLRGLILECMENLVLHLESVGRFSWLGLYEVLGLATYEERLIKMICRIVSYPVLESRDNGEYKSRHRQVHSPGV